MKIVETSIYSGPSIYSRERVIHHTLQFGASRKDLTLDIANENLPLDVLFQHLPGLRERCACGAPDIFEIALSSSDIFPVNHLLEHVCIELQNLSGETLTCVHCHGEHGISDNEMVYPYEYDKVGVASARLALDWVQSMLADEPSSAETPANTFDFVESLEAFLKLAQRRAPPIQDKVLLKAARERKIPVTQIAHRLFQLGHGCFQERVSGSKTSHTNIISSDIASNKDYSRRILGSLGLPVPRFERVYSARRAVRAAKNIGFPVVVKPNAGKMGHAVSVGMKNEEEVRAAFKRALTQGRSVLVEEFVPGEDYRIIVVNGQMVAAAKRIPAHIVGDGTQTIEQIMDEVNSDPRRGDGAQQAWTRLEFDEQSDRLLAELGYTSQSVPKEGEIVYLRRNANTSCGGTAVDVTDEVHPDNLAIAVRAAMGVGLDVAGVDLLTKDISRPILEQGGSICEINSRPGLRKHMWPAKGKPRDVTGPILSMLFPPGKPSRITISAVTGTGETAMTARMLAHIMMLNGKHVGLANVDGVYIGGQQIAGAGISGPDAARMILMDSIVDCAVFEIIPEDVLRVGLGYDMCDVSAVVNNVDEEKDVADKHIDAMRVVTSVTRKSIIVGEGADPARFTSQHDDTELFNINLDTASDVTSSTLAGIKEGADGISIFVIDNGEDAAHIPLRDVISETNNIDLSSAVFATSMAFKLNVDPSIIQRAINSFNYTN